MADISHSIGYDRARDADTARDAIMTALNMLRLTLLAALALACLTFYWVMAY